MDKEMKTKSKISGQIIRSAAWAVFLSVAFIALTSAFNSPNAWHKSVMATGGYDRMAKSPSQPRALSFAERVVFQRAIEEVYWQHRIWPKENPNRKPSLDAVMSQAQLENKVASYLRNSLVLEDYWQRPITAQQLQAEMDRMARDTKQPEVLRELFEALGNDPGVIAECLARPTLADRLIADLSAQDPTRHVESPQTDALSAMSVATTLGQVVYTLPEIGAAGDAPCTDQWGATTTINAPEARYQHTAVWTGSEMIVWGGWAGGPTFNTGGRYNPSTDSWTATSTNNAPTARRAHTAVWIGSEMIVWGGGYYDGVNFQVLNTGGRYDPSTDSWTATSTTNAPIAREIHTAVWTGSEMIVWGGVPYTSTGGKYNPSTDSWIATSTTNAPTARFWHTAVWTGSEMIVWGGWGLYHLFNTGGRYDPGSDSWTATSNTNAPEARYEHTAVWAGTQMIIWGGDEFAHPSAGLNTGGRYNPSTDTWIPTSTTNAPSGRFNHTAIWTGRIMIVWSGESLLNLYGTNTGGRYDPGTNTWIATSTTYAPAGRHSHTAIWTGGEMIVWGGYAYSGRLTNTGGRYCGQYPTPTPTPTPTASPTPTLTPTPTPTPTPTAPPLTIIQPNGGEVWLMGSVHEIKWDSTNMKQSDHLLIHYSRDGGATWFRIAQVPAFTFGYWWHVDNYPTTQGRVKILLQENRSVTDQSDANFTVQRRPYITLHRPNGGEVFTIGQYINIHWSRQNPGGNTVDIDYSTDNGTTWIRIATQAQDTGWYLWNVPGPATTTAKARIRFHETPSVNDTSDAVFTIVSL
jgi:N-acetylneuraminic acid mutarotase